MRSDSGVTSTSWFDVALQPAVVLRSVRVSLLVGTVLIAINQGDLLFNGVLLPDLYWKIPLTYCVPYAVSTYAAVDAILSKE